MFDTSHALNDMAKQIRACRAADGLTLQQLAARSGVAASTIHKVEARQMVPTVSVLLKIAKGLGCRPEELIRDTPEDSAVEHNGIAATPDATMNGTPERVAEQGNGTVAMARPSVGVWQIDLSADKLFPPLDLDPRQRAIVLVERGEVDLQAGSQRIRMAAGDCIEIEGGRIESLESQPQTASLTLIVSPPGDLDRRLDQPRPSAPASSSQMPIYARSRESIGDRAGAPFVDFSLEDQFSRSWSHGRIDFPCDPGDLCRSRTESIPYLQD